MSEKVRREKIYKVFTQNLDWVKERVGHLKNIPSGYICPLCTRLFKEDALNHASNNMLTIEHVPPESLKGKPLLLTCKECNSNSGHTTDFNLKEALTEMDFTAGLPNSGIKTSFHHEGNKVNGAIKIDNDGKWNMVFGRNSHPDEYKKLIDKVFNPSNKQLTLKDGIFQSQFISPKFTFTRKLKADTKQAEVALLRVAYLLAFNSFGHGFIINPLLQKVREQILNPEKDILPRPFWIKYDFPNEPNGIYLIKEPKELRCFIVMFDLITDSKIRKVTIALPGFSEPGLDIYSNIGRILKNETAIKLDNLSGIDYTNKAEIFDSLGYWKYIDQE